MARLSVAVMADKRRAHLVKELVKRLGIEPDRVVWDRLNNRWDTGRRAWQAHDPDADYQMVIQDDALVCQDLIPGLEKALDHVPGKAIVSPFVGTRRPAPAKMDRAVQLADDLNATWLILGPLNWGVAIIAPTYTIKDMIRWCDKQTYPNYDKRVGQFYRRVLTWPTWHTWPNLVEHLEVPSLVGHGGGRVSRKFIGADASALDVDWSGPVLNLGSATALNNAYIQQQAAIHNLERKRAQTRLRQKQQQRTQELIRKAQWRELRRQRSLMNEGSG